jgi:hypothetical protein
MGGNLEESIGYIFFRRNEPPSELLLLEVL